MENLLEVNDLHITFWTFKLKDGLKWSNGDPLTANDFEYAWKYALKPELPILTMRKN